MSRRYSIVSDSVIGESLIDEIFGEIKRTNSLRRDDFNDLKRIFEYDPSLSNTTEQQTVREREDCTESDISSIEDEMASDVSFASRAEPRLSPAESQPPSIPSKSSSTSSKVKTYNLLKANGELQTIKTVVSEKLPTASQSNSFQETNVATEVEDNRESEPIEKKETTETQETQPKLHREETTIRLIEEASVDSNSDLSRSPEKVPCWKLCVCSCPRNEDAVESEGTLSIRNEPTKQEYVPKTRVNKFNFPKLGLRKRNQKSSFRSSLISDGSTAAASPKVIRSRANKIFNFRKSTMSGSLKKRPSSSLI